jgi:hypothetical protein
MVRSPVIRGHEVRLIEKCKHWTVSYWIEAKPDSKSVPLLMFIIYLMVHLIKPIANLSVTNCNGYCVTARNPELPQASSAFVFWSLARIILFTIKERTYLFPSVQLNAGWVWKVMSLKVHWERRSKFAFDTGKCHHPFKKSNAQLCLSPDRCHKSHISSEKHE